MTSNLEKIFFNWILKHPQYIKIIHGFYFENEYIQFIYDCIRNEYLASEDKEVPGNKEIVALTKQYDKTDNIDIPVIKALLKIDWKDYREEFVKPRFEAWVKYNSLTNGLLNSYENLNGIDKTDLTKIDEALGNIRFNIDEALNVSLEKGTLGLDFDDPDSHDQELELNKITSGYQCFDEITDGGFDRKTLTVYMGAPGSGKSMALQNLGVNAANAGYNVAYITLELSDKKAMKRIGSMRLEIPINEYAEKAKDKEYIKEKIKHINKKNNESAIFSSEPGKLFIKEFPSGSATVSDIENYVKQVKEEAGIEIDMLLVDYLQIMGTEKGIDRNMLYLKGEHLSVGLRAIGQKYNLACVTATQISKEKYGANNIDLNDIPESKAIADTADMVWAIIQTAPMKAEGTYHWKHNKLRDSDTHYERIGLKLDKKFLRLVPGSDWFIESTL